MRVAPRGPDVRLTTSHAAPLASGPRDGSPAARPETVGASWRRGRAPTIPYPHARDDDETAVGARAASPHRSRRTAEHRLLSATGCTHRRDPLELRRRFEMRENPLRVGKRDIACKGDTRRAKGTLVAFMEKVDDAFGTLKRFRWALVPYGRFGKETVHALRSSCREGVLALQCRYGIAHDGHVRAEPTCKTMDAEPESRMRAQIGSESLEDVLFYANRRRRLSRSAGDQTVRLYSTPRP